MFDFIKRVARAGTTEKPMGRMVISAEVRNALLAGEADMVDSTGEDTVVLYNRMTISQDRGIVSIEFYHNKVPVSSISVVADLTRGDTVNLADLQGSFILKVTA